MFRNMTIDGRTFLGAVLIVGYMLLINRMIGLNRAMPNVALVKDSLIVLGPAIGVIVGAIWRSTGAEERTREILAHGAVASAPALDASPPEIKKAVQAGTAAGVTDAASDLLGIVPHPEIVAAPASYVGPEMPDVAAAAIETPEVPTWAR